MRRAAFVLCLALAACSPSGSGGGEALVKGGRYTPGNDSIYPEERQTGAVSVNDFWIDTHEVTNAEFAAFVKATGYVTQAEKGFAGNPAVPQEQWAPGSAVFIMPAPGLRPGWTWLAGANWQHPEGPGSSIEGKDAEPVVQVSQADALAYASWKGRDLPTEAEWEWAAARGGTLPDRKRPMKDGKPSGNNWDGEFPLNNTGADGFVMRAPVGSFAADAGGLYDMTGNVWELTKSAWTPGHGAQADAAAPAYTIKGGSFLCGENWCARYRPQSRQSQDATLATNHVGFRTVRRGK